MKTAEDILKKHHDEYYRTFQTSENLNSFDYDFSQKTFVIKAMEEYKNQFILPNEWISVEERLPEIGKKVLIFCKPIQECTGFYWGNDKKGLSNYWSILDVTHWKPLPSPPNN